MFNIMLENFKPVCMKCPSKLPQDDSVVTSNFQSMSVDFPGRETVKEQYCIWSQKTTEFSEKPF